MTASRVLVMLVLGVVCSPARAGEIVGFKINKITGLNGVELADRFGTGPADLDHLVNYADCLAYLGIQPGQSLAEDAPETVEPATEVTSVDVAEVADTTPESVDASDAVEETDAGGGGGGEGDLVRKVEFDWSINDSLVGKWWYSVKIGSCSESAEVDEAESDSCVYLRQKTELVPYSSHTFELRMTDLLGTECAKGDTDEQRLYFTIQSDLDYNNRTTQSVVVEMDYDPPESVRDVAIEAGESNLDVSWTDEDNTETVTYKVYYATRAFDATDIAADAPDLNTKGDLTATSYQITGLENGTKVYVGIVSVDAFDNESPLSDLVSATPVLVTDGFEYYKEAGGSEAGGFCFVATATYGSVLHPAVGVLRQFRDRFLLSHAPGAALVALYYRLSPPLAETIRHHTWLRVPAQALLAPLVVLAWLLNLLGPLPVLGVATLVPAGLWWRRRVRTRRG